MVEELSPNSPELTSFDDPICSGFYPAGIDDCSKQATDKDPLECLVGEAIYNPTHFEDLYVESPKLFVMDDSVVHSYYQCSGDDLSPQYAELATFLMNDDFESADTAKETDMIEMLVAEIASSTQILPAIVQPLNFELESLSLKHFLG